MRSALFRTTVKAHRLRTSKRSTSMTCALTNRAAETASAECCTITYARSPEKSAATTSRSTCGQATKARNPSTGTSECASRKSAWSRFCKSRKHHNEVPGAICSGASRASRSCKAFLIILHRQPAAEFKAGIFQLAGTAESHLLVESQASFIFRGNNRDDAVYAGLPRLCFQPAVQAAACVFVQKVLVHVNRQVGRIPIC